jgi:hypothetical protein
MIIVAGLWELGWNTPIKEIELWEYPLRDYGVDGFIMSPVSGIRNDFVTEVPDLAAKLDDLRATGHQIVFVDERGEEELTDFEHPENAVYVFGIASLSTMAAYKKDGDRTLVIKTKNKLATLWPHQCAVLVLHDRMNKDS